MIRSFEGHTPVSLGRSYIAENATLIGDVTLHDGASIWPGAVLRGDCASITVGENSNIQDNSVVHNDHGIPVVIGKNCLIGHSAVLHSCVLEEGVVIGMGAIVLSGAVIGTGSIIAAGALVTQNTVIPPHSQVMGIPGTVKKELDSDSHLLTAERCRIYRSLAEAELTIREGALC